MLSDNPQTMRTLQISTALLYCLFSVGICFGFAALKPILIASGVYSKLCIHAEGVHSQCIEQEITLNQMFTWAAVGTNVSAFPIGLLLDRYGPRTTSIIGSLLILLGSIGLAVASEQLDIYIPAYTILATGGSFLLLSSFSLASLVPGKSGLIVSAMTGAFDASSGLFLLYRLVFQAFGSPSVRTFFSVYCIVPLAILLVQIWYMPRRTTGSTSKINDTSVSPAEADSVATETPRITETTNLLDRTDESAIFEAGKALSDPVDGVMHQATALQVLTSFWFLLPALVMITSLIRVNFYIATVNAHLIFLLGANDAALDMNLFDILLPVGGILAIPLIGWILDTYTTPTVYLLTLLLSATSGLLSFVPNKYVQMLHILTFVVLRPWIYSILPGTVTKLFGHERFGAFYGLIMAIAGLVNLLAHDLEVLTYNKYAGSFYPVDAGLVSVSCVTLVATVIYMKIKVSRMA